MLIGDDNQVSQFNVQSTEILTTRNGGLREESKDETSLFDKQLYERSLLENPSQDIMMTGLGQSIHMVGNETSRQQIQETLSEN